MASNAKKHKAKNSYLENGADKKDLKLKGIMYFTKRKRNQLKEEVKKYGDQSTSN